MKIYLASAYSRRDEMREVAKTLMAMGHVITSTWLQTNFRETGDGEIPTPPDERKTWALKDLQDIRQADCVVSFTGGGRRGGRHVEFGYALGMNKVTFIIGEPEHIFHCLGIRVFPTLGDFLDALASPAGIVCPELRS